MKTQKRPLQRRSTLPAASDPPRPGSVAGRSPSPLCKQLGPAVANAPATTPQSVKIGPSITAHGRLLVLPVTHGPRDDKQRQIACVAHDSTRRLPRLVHLQFAFQRRSDLTATTILALACIWSPPMQRSREDGGLDPSRRGAHTVKHRTAVRSVRVPHAAAQILNPNPAPSASKVASSPAHRSASATVSNGSRSTATRLPC